MSVSVSVHSTNFENVTAKVESYTNPINGRFVHIAIWGNGYTMLNLDEVVARALLDSLSKALKEQS